MSRTYRFGNGPDGLPAETAADARRRVRAEKSERAMREWRRTFAFDNEARMDTRAFESMARGFAPLPDGEGW